MGKRMRKQAMIFFGLIGLSNLGCPESLDAHWESLTSNRLEASITDLYWVAMSSNRPDLVVANRMNIAQNDAFDILKDGKLRRCILYRFTGDGDALISFDFRYPVKSDCDIVTALVSADKICFGAFSNANIIFSSQLPFSMGKYCKDDIGRRIEEYSYVYPVGFDDSTRHVYVSVGIECSGAAAKFFDLPFNWIDKPNCFTEQRCWGGDERSLETYQTVAAIVNLIVANIRTTVYHEVKSTLRPI